MVECIHCGKDIEEHNMYSLACCLSWASGYIREKTLLENQRRLMS